MRIYEKNEKYTLILGDTLEVLKKMPSESVDMIVTSPPYNINLKDRKDTNIATYDNYEDNLEWTDYCKNQIEVLNELYRISKKNGILFYNHKDKFKNENYKNPIEIIFKSKWNIKQNIIWDRGSSLTYNAGMFGDVYENIYYCYKGESPKTKTKHNVLGTIWRINKEVKNDHPAPFPLELPLRAIYSIFDDTKGKVILDPYNGSGTTGVASLLLDDKYIGIDMSEKYLLKAKERLNNYKKESERGQKEIIKHHVEKKYNNKKIDDQMTIFDLGKNNEI